VPPRRGHEEDHGSHARVGQGASSRPVPAAVPQVHLGRHSHDRVRLHHGYPGRLMRPMRPPHADMPTRLPIEQPPSSSSDLARAPWLQVVFVVVLLLVLFVELYSLSVRHHSPPHHQHSHAIVILISPLSLCFTIYQHSLFLCLSVFPACLLSFYSLQCPCKHATGPNQINNPATFDNLASTASLASRGIFELVYEVDLVFYLDHCGRGRRCRCRWHACGCCVIE